MILKDVISHEPLDLDEVWRARATLFPHGLTGADGEVVPDLFSLFAAACAHGLRELGLDWPVLDAAAGEMHEVLATLETRDLDRLPLNEATRGRFEQRFYMPPHEAEDWPELAELSMLTTDMIGACESYEDLRVLARLFEAIACEMAANEAAVPAGAGGPASSHTSAGASGSPA